MLVLIGDEVGEQQDPVGEVEGAVDRVDDPPATGGPGDGTRLLAVDPVVGATTRKRAGRYFKSVTFSPLPRGPPLYMARSCTAGPMS